MATTDGSMPTVDVDAVKMRAVQVNYPKKKPRINLEQLGEVKEPERRSMYQVMLQNLKAANRATFLHRIIYVGEHRLAGYEPAKELFAAIISQCNETYCIERLTGFLLYYSRHFVHMVEGDEDNVNKHLRLLLACEAPLGRTKLLIHVSNINQRFFEEWTSYTDAPSKLLERLDVDADLQQSGRCIYNCIKKLYALMGSLAHDLLGESADQQEDLATLPSAENSLTSSKVFSYGSLGVADAHRFFLPEYELLDFVVQSSFTMPLQEYSELYGVVPMRDIYKGGRRLRGDRATEADRLQIECGPCRTTSSPTTCSSGRTSAPPSCPRRRASGNMQGRPAPPPARSACSK
uniref:BLUF domain-containing protein n=1 Tax=Dendroctonus ponderosae TaxID=77166 RepID=A0AAR5Q531_DENPD